MAHIWRNILIFLKMIQYIGKVATDIDRIRRPMWAQIISTRKHMTKM